MCLRTVHRRLVYLLLDEGPTVFVCTLDDGASRLQAALCTLDIHAESRYLTRPVSRSGYILDVKMRNRHLHSRER